MQTRRFLDVDSRGRVSLAKFGYKNTQLLAIQDEDGTITLEEVVPLTRAELEHFTDPAAIEALQRAWTQAATGKARPFTPTGEEPG
ncbi:MAG: hypothetical protein HKN74_02155 [Acidimicrobiia bacterium]|nr:hypothetical protein [Acidimicrobiia bacterium]NNF09064.1 hypothetical protein [Acidimicrobiia bacterium]NNL69934.1 hypothetical protein [Acidimicrobiia bacterium]